MVMLIAIYLQYNCFWCAVQIFLARCTNASAQYKCFSAVQNFAYLRGGVKVSPSTACCCQKCCFKADRAKLHDRNILVYMEQFLPRQLRPANDFKVYKKMWF